LLPVTSITPHPVRESPGSNPAMRIVAKRTRPSRIALASVGQHDRRAQLPRRPQPCTEPRRVGVGRLILRMIYRAFWFVLLAAIALSDGARSGEGAESFEYSARLQSEIVAPILQRELGSDLVRYDDPANPRISRRCDEIWLVFQF